MPQIFSMLLLGWAATAGLSVAQCVENASIPGLCTQEPMEARGMPLEMTGDQFCSRLGGRCQDRWGHQPGGECCLDIEITVNDLAGLPPLPKPHYSAIIHRPQSHLSKGSSEPPGRAVTRYLGIAWNSY